MKIAIYTALYGKKDILRPPLDYVADTLIDYYIFTDEVSLNIAPYKTIIRPAKFKDIAKNARFYKIMGDPVLKDYNILLWHDANIQIKHQAINALLKHAQNTFLTVFTHPHRDCFYSESMTCIRGNKDFSLRILKQTLEYFFNGLPTKHGMYSTGLMIKNFTHQTYNVLPFWWQETLRHSRRDQLSFAYSVFRKKSNLHIIEDNVFDNAYSIYHPHCYQEYLETSNIMRYNFLFLKTFSFYTVKAIRKIKKMF